MSEPYGTDFKLRLSSLVDGEVDVTEVAHLCSGWKEEESARRAWHTYQLIGDALRSDELATSPSRDCAFMERLRQRLAAEPVVLAPQEQIAELHEEQVALSAAGGSWHGMPRRWRIPVTAAASVLAVTGVLMVARVSGLLPADTPNGATLAQQNAPGIRAAAAPQALAAAPSSRLQTVSTQTGSAPASDLDSTQPQTVIANRKLIRDARLDQYLAAHKEFGGSTAFGVPSGFLRSATSESRDR